MSTPDVRSSDGEGLDDTPAGRVAAFLDAWQASGLDDRIHQHTRSGIVLLASDLRVVLGERHEFDNEADALNADLEEAQATVARLRDQLSEQDCS